MPAAGLPVASITTSVAGCAIAARASSVTKVVPAFAASSSDARRVALGLPAHARERRRARARGARSATARTWSPGVRRACDEVHRAELAGADQHDAHGAAFRGRALLEQAVEVHRAGSRAWLQLTDRAFPEGSNGRTDGLAVYRSRGENACHEPRSALARPGLAGRVAPCVRASTCSGCRRASSTREQRYRYVNAGVLRALSGKREAEFLGRTPDEVFGSSPRTSAARSSQRALARRDRRSSTARRSRARAPAAGCARTTCPLRDEARRRRRRARGAGRRAAAQGRRGRARRPRAPALAAHRLRWDSRSCTSIRAA